MSNEPSLSTPSSSRDTRRMPTGRISDEEGRIDIRRHQLLRELEARLTYRKYTASL